MSCVARIDAVIALLQAAKDDASKVDSGKTGAPGTRLRKAAGAVQNELAELKKDVLAARPAPVTT